MSTVGRKRISKWDLENPKSSEISVDKFLIDKEQILDPKNELKDCGSEGILLKSKDQIQGCGTAWETTTLQSKDKVNDIRVQVQDMGWEEPLPQYKEFEQNALYNKHLNDDTYTKIQGVCSVGEQFNSREHMTEEAQSDSKTLHLETPINSVGAEVKKSFRPKEPLLESPPQAHSVGDGVVSGKRPFQDEESVFGNEPVSQLESGSWDRLLCKGGFAPEAPLTEANDWASEGMSLRGKENVVKRTEEVNTDSLESNPRHGHDDVSDEKWLGKRNGDISGNPPGFSERETHINDETNNQDNDSGWTSRGGNESGSPKWGFKDSGSDSWESKSKWEIPKKQGIDFGSGNWSSNNTPKFDNHNLDKGFAERNEVLSPTDFVSRISSPSPPSFPFKRAKPTGICNDFIKGKCQRGDMCRFAHQASDFNLPSSNGQDQQPHRLPPPPAHIDPGKWNPDPSSHHPPPDRSNRRLIAFPCKFYAYGKCRNGANCRFSHAGEVLTESGGQPFNTIPPSPWSNKPNTTGSGSAPPAAVSAVEILPLEVKANSSRSRWDKDSNETRGPHAPKINKPEVSFSHGNLGNSYNQYPAPPPNPPFGPQFQQNCFRPMEAPPRMVNPNNFPVGGMPGLPNMRPGGDHLRPVVNVPPTSKPVTSEELARITNISASLAQLLGSGQQLPQLYASLHPITGNEIRPEHAPANASTPILGPAPGPAPAPVPALAPAPPSANVLPPFSVPAHFSVPPRPPIASVPLASHVSSEIVRPLLVASVRPSAIPVTVSESTNQPVAPVTQSSVPVQGSAEAQVKQVKKTVSGGEINGAGSKEERKEKEGAGVVENAEGSRKGEEGKKGKDGKGMRAFKFSLVECIKDILKPTWRDGQIDKEGYKMVVKKVAEKVIGTLEENIPQSQDKVDQYLTFSKTKLTKLVQAYVEKQHQQQQQHKEEN